MREPLRYPEQRQAFAEWLARKQLKPVTIKHYLYYYDRIPAPSQLDQAKVDAFLNRFNNPISRAFLKNFKDYLIKNTSDVAVLGNLAHIDVPRITGRKKERIPIWLTKDEVFAMEKVMHSEKAKIMLLLSFHSGLRLGELLRIKKGSFNWVAWWKSGEKESGEVRVIGKGDKEGIGIVPSYLMKRIEAWVMDMETRRLVPDDTKLFAMGAGRWRELLSDASQKALGKHVHPHALRHSTATHLLNEGLDLREVQETMRHSSISSTQIYTHINKESLKKKHEAIWNH